MSSTTGAAAIDSTEDSLAESPAEYFIRDASPDPGILRVTPSRLVFVGEETHAFPFSELKQITRAPAALSSTIVVITKSEKRVYFQSVQQIESMLEIIRLFPLGVESTEPVSSTEIRAVEAPAPPVVARLEEEASSSTWTAAAPAPSAAAAAPEGHRTMFRFKQYSPTGDAAAPFKFSTAGETTPFNFGATSGLGSGPASQFKFKPAARVSSGKQEVGTAPPPLQAPPLPLPLGGFPSMGGFGGLGGGLGGPGGFGTFGKTSPFARGNSPFANAPFTFPTLRTPAQVAAAHAPPPSGDALAGESDEAMARRLQQQESMGGPGRSYGAMEHGRTTYHGHGEYPSYGDYGHAYGGLGGYGYGDYGGDGGGIGIDDYDTSFLEGLSGGHDPSVFDNNNIYDEGSDEEDPESTPLDAPPRPSDANASSTLDEIKAATDAPTSSSQWADMRRLNQLRRDQARRGGLEAKLRVVAIRPELEFGDKINLPSAVLGEATRRRLQFPLCFKLTLESAPDKPMVCGVNDFTAFPGTAQVPRWIMEALGVQENQTILFHSTVLPRGTFVQLQPVSADWVDLPLQTRESILEAQLVNYQCLTKDTTVRVRNGGRVYELRVNSTLPADSISIIDADLETDVIEPLEAMVTVTPLELGTPHSGSVEEGQYQFHVLAVADPNKRVVINVTCTTGDPCLYASFSHRKPTAADATWRSQTTGSNQLSISSSDAEFKIGNLYISVQSHAGVTAFTITCTEEERTNESPGRTLGDAPVATEGETQKCPHCQKMISTRGFMMHEMGCARMNGTCPICNVSMVKTELAKHQALAHKLYKCECGVELEQTALLLHKQNDCALKSVTCRFCTLAFSKGELKSHEEMCGSRTAHCSRCFVAVPRMWLVYHLQEAHGVAPSEVDLKTELQTKTPTGAAVNNARWDAHIPAIPVEYDDQPSAYRRQTAQPAANRSPSRTTCEQCGEVCTNFEELQIHMLTACVAREAHEANAGKDVFSPDREGGAARPPPASQPPIPARLAAPTMPRMFGTAAALAASVLPPMPGLAQMPQMPQMLDDDDDDEDGLDYLRPSRNGGVAAMSWAAQLAAAGNAVNGLEADEFLRPPRAPYASLSAEQREQTDLETALSLSALMDSTHIADDKHDENDAL